MAEDRIFPLPPLKGPGFLVDHFGDPESAVMKANEAILAKRLHAAKEAGAVCYPTSMAQNEAAQDRYNRLLAKSFKELR